MQRREACSSTRVDLPEGFQATVWTGQTNRQQRHSRIVQVVVAQVQLSQAGRLRAEDRGQRLAAPRREVTATQPEDTRTGTMFYFLPDENFLPPDILGVTLCTYRALLETLTTGSSLSRAFSEAEYFFRSNTSRSLSEESRMKTRADH